MRSGCFSELPGNNHCVATRGRRIKLIAPGDARNKLSRVVRQANRRHLTRSVLVKEADLLWYPQAPRVPLVTIPALADDHSVEVQNGPVKKPRGRENPGDWTVTPHLEI